MKPDTLLIILCVFFLTGISYSESDISEDNGWDSWTVEVENPAPVKKTGNIVAYRSPEDIGTSLRGFLKSIHKDYNRFRVSQRIGQGPVYLDFNITSSGRVENIKISSQVDNIEKLSDLIVAGLSRCTFKKGASFTQPYNVEFALMLYPPSK